MGLSNTIIAALVHWVKKLLLHSCCSRGWGQGELPKQSTGLSWAALTPRVWYTLGSPAPNGKRTWEAGDEDNLMQCSRLSSHWGTAGREECLGQEFMLSRILPTQPHLQPKGNREQLSQGEQKNTLLAYCSHWILKDFDQQGLLSDTYLCKQWQNSCTG